MPRVAFFPVIMRLKDGCSSRSSFDPGAADGPVRGQPLRPRVSAPVEAFRARHGGAETGENDTTRAMRPPSLN